MKQVVKPNIYEVATYDLANVFLYAGRFDPMAPLLYELMWINRHEGTMRVHLSRNQMKKALGCGEAALRDAMQLLEALQLIRTAEGGKAGEKAGGKAGKKAGKRIIFVVPYLTSQLAEIIETNCNVVVMVFAAMRKHLRTCQNSYIKDEYSIANPKKRDRTRNVPNFMKNVDKRISRMDASANSTND